MLDFFPWLLRFDRALPCCYDTFNSRQSHIIYTVTTCFTYIHTYIIKLQITYIKCDKIGKNPKICKKIVKNTTLFSVPDFDISVFFRYFFGILSVPDFSGPDIWVPDFSVPGISGHDFSVPDFSGHDISVPEFSVPDFDTRSPILEQCQEVSN